MNRLTARIAAATAATALVVTGFATAAAHTTGTQTAAHPQTRKVSIQNGVVAEAVRVDGQETETVDEQPATAGNATQPRLAGTPASCADGAYTMSGYKASGTLRFGYNGAGAPASVARYASLAVRNSLVAVTSGANRCKLPATVKASGLYTGGSTRTPQVSTSGSCFGNDGVNVVGWGILPTGYLAITCIYFVNGKVLNADVMVNRRYSWFLSKPAGCRSTYDLQSVLTHEQGHSFGLSHVDPNAHGSEVMGTLIGPCDISKRQLGRGDYGALARLYGTR